MRWTPWCGFRFSGRKPRHRMANRTSTLQKLPLLLLRAIDLGRNTDTA